MKLLLLVFILLFQTLTIPAQESKLLFFEDFEDTNFESRGWYDHLKGKLSADEHIDGSNYSLEIKFLKGATGAEGGTPGRHLFEETDEVCLSFFVKYSENYIGSAKPYHPHEFHFITNKDSKWVGPAFTHLTTYIEHNAGYPLLAIQDGENIDQSRVGKNLVGITEERAVAGCNGSSDGYPDDCYKSGNRYVNGKLWKAEQKYFSDEPGKYYKNDWHHIESYFKFNSIVDGKGINDGTIKYWYDGELIINHEDILMRTAEHPDMKFNQFLIAPYIGDGSPGEQTMWIDNLKVTTSREVTRVSDNQYYDEIEIIPNPVNEYIEIKTVETGLRPVSTGIIEIYNIFGKRMKVPIPITLNPNPKNPKQTHPESKEGVRVNVSDLPNGVYYIRVGASICRFIKI